MNITVRASVDHVLPAKFWGINSSSFRFAVDSPNATFQQLFRDLRPELWRINWNHSNTFLPGTADMNGFQTFILAVQAAAGTRTLVQVPQAPLQYPNCTIGPGVASNVSGGSDPRSPGRTAASVAAMITAGIDVFGVEVGNEPSLASITAPNDFLAWYGNKTSPGTSTYAGFDNGAANDAWAIAHHRDYVNACKAVLPAATQYYAYALATGFFTAPVYTQRFTDGNVYVFAGSDPSSVGSNFPHFDVLSYHPYSGNPSHQIYSANVTQDVQGSLNAVFYAPNTDGKSSVTGSAPVIYAQFVGSGHPEKAISVTETAFFRNDYLGGLGDLSFAITCANNQAAWNLRDVYWYAFDTQLSDIWFTTLGAPYTPTYRHFMFRDMVGPFLSTYKRIALPTVDVASGMTPMSSYNNSVSRIHTCFGYDSNGNLGCLIANIDLATAEQVTVALPGTPIGPVVGKRIVAGGSAPADLGQITITSPTFTTGTAGVPSLGPGEALYLEIPLQTVITPPPPPPPPPNTNAAISTLSDNFNGNAVSNLWTVSTVGTAATLADTNQRLEVTTTGGPTFDWLNLVLDNNNILSLRRNATNLEAVKVVGGASTTLAPVALPGAVYLQVRESGGTITFEYGTDPAGAFTPLATLAAPFAVTGLQVRIGSGSGVSWSELQSVGRYNLTGDRIFVQYVQSGSSSQPTVFDNVNTGAVSLTDLGSWVAAVQVNATDAVSLPTSTDLGVWTVAQQVDALFANPDRVGRVPV